MLFVKLSIKEFFKLCLCLIFLPFQKRLGDLAVSLFHAKVDTRGHETPCALLVETWKSSRGRGGTLALSLMQMVAGCSKAVERLVETLTGASLCHRCEIQLEHNQTALEIR